MNLENLIGSVVRGALTGKRGKRRKGAAKYISGGSGSLLNASTLLAMAGVAWGVYETMTKKEPVYAGPGPQGGGFGPATPQGPAAAGPWTGGAMPPVPGNAVPPVPGAAAGGPPPLPNTAPDVPPDVVRLVRLVISAARADGSLSADEQATILEHARAVGAEGIVQRELASSVTLAQIVAGVTVPAQREELYTLAFAIVRGDEQVTGGERIYLAQLANQLGLDPAATARLEQAAAARIDAAAQE
jgi:uncharacterized membrane protein YebE (DUF533 family)